MKFPPLPLSAGTTWAVVGTLACAIMAPLEPNLLEEGLLVHFASRMARGEHLYRDLVWYTGPLPYELLAGVFRIFGEQILAGRVALALLHGASCTSVYGLARLAGAGPLAHPAALAVAAAPMLLFPLFSIFFYSTVAVHLTLIAAYAAARGFGSAGWAVSAGVLVACTALTKQNLGIALGTGLLLVIATGAPHGQKLRRSLQFVLGGALIAAATVTLYAARGDLGPLVASLIWLPLSLGEAFYSPYVNLWPPGKFSPALSPSKLLYLPSLWTITHALSDRVSAAIVLLTQVLYALPILAVFLTAVVRLAGPLTGGFWAHTAAFLALAVNLFPRSDWGHLVFVLPSAGAQVLILFGARTSGKWPRLANWTSLGITLLLAGGAVAAAVAIYRVSEASNLGPRVSLRPVSQLVRSPPLTNAIDFLRRNTRPDEPIFVPRSEPLIYFATGTRNPTPFGGVFPGMREEQERAIIEGLGDVRFVVMSDLDQPIFTYYRDELPAVQAYLERHYSVVPESAGGWISLLERGADRGATAIDLIEALPTARSWVRHLGGAEIPTRSFALKLPTKQNRRPLAFRVGRMGGGVDFDVTIPVGAVFQGDVGLGALTGFGALHLHPGDVRMVASVSRGDEFQEIVSVRLPKGYGGKHWTQLEADLSAYAGEHLTLRLELVPDGPMQRGFLSWWGSPRIAFANNARGDPERR